jgi:hypothetical protein
VPCFNISAGASSKCCGDLGFLGENEVRGRDLRETGVSFFSLSALIRRIRLRVRLSSTTSSINISTMSSPTIPRKRPRPVQACLHCRTKKLKCDKQQPCAQCTKYNRVDGCVYDELAGSLGRFSPSAEGERIPKSPRTDGPTANSGRNARPRSEADVPPSAASATKDHYAIANVSALVNASPVTNLQGTTLLQRPNQRLGTQEQSHASEMQRNCDSIGNQVPGTGRRYHGLNNTRSLIALVCPISQNYRSTKLTLDLVVP